MLDDLLGDAVDELARELEAAQDLLGVVEPLGVHLQDGVEVAHVRQVLVQFHLQVAERGILNLQLQLDKLIVHVQFVLT